VRLLYDFLDLFSPGSGLSGNLAALTAGMLMHLALVFMKGKLIYLVGSDFESLDVPCLISHRSLLSGSIDFSL
jgi:hypothetical protein